MNKYQRKRSRITKGYMRAGLSKREAMKLAKETNYSREYMQNFCNVTLVLKRTVRAYRKAMKISTVLLGEIGKALLGIAEKLNKRFG